MAEHFPEAMELAAGRRAMLKGYFRPALDGAYHDFTQNAAAHNWIALEDAMKVWQFISSRSIEQDIVPLIWDKPKADWWSIIHNAVAKEEADLNAAIAEGRARQWVMGSDGKFKQKDLRPS